jgi:hypothetical protein
VAEYPQTDMRESVAYEAVSGGDPRGKGRAAMVQPRQAAIRVYTDAATPLRGGAGARRALSRLSWRSCLFVVGEEKGAAAAGDIVPTSKPDGDNIQKCVGDALNKIVWTDDSIIIMWQCLKLYSDFPRLRVSVWAWNDVPAMQEPNLL